MIRRLLQRRKLSTQVNVDGQNAVKSKFDNVWGFCTKERAETILKDERRALFSIDVEGRLGSVKELLSARGFDEKDFKDGCELAYRRMAEIYERGESVFESDFSEVVEDRLAVQLDDQLQAFRLQGKVPRLGLESVHVDVLGLLAIPKGPQRMEGSVSRLLPNVVGKSTWASTVNHFVSLGLHFAHPTWNELLVPVEYTVRERFALITQDDVSTDPPRSYVNEMVQRMKASEQHLLVNTIAALRGAYPPDVEERKHLFIFAADLANQAENLEKGTEADFLEFRLRSMGVPIQLPKGINFRGDV